MGFRINTNIAAMNAHNNATINNRDIDKSLGRLSSGIRINTAADDASGMVIANSLRSQASSLAQAVRNGNDAIGLIQTADGALDEYSKILDTIKTKSIQAASDGQNTTSRLAIQKDIDRLMESLNNIATTTSFNGQKLLSGTFVNKAFQMGANANESVSSSIASTETSQIGQTTRARLDITTMGENRLSVRSTTTGETITLEPIDLKPNNKPINGMGEVANQINRHSGDTGITAQAIVRVTTGEITSGVTGTDFAINGINIGAINVSANDSQGTLMNAINSKTSETGVAATKTADGKLMLAAADGRVIEVTGDIAVSGSTAKELSTVGYLEVVQAGSSTFQIKGTELGLAVGAELVTTGDVTTIEDSYLAIGSTINTGSTIAAGSKLGVVITSTADTFTNISSTKDSTLAVGSIIASGSTISEGSVLASKIVVDGDTVLTSDMFVKAGSTLTVGTVFDAGTVIEQDMTQNGNIYKAGTILSTDLILDTSVTLSKDMTIKVADLAGDRDSAIGAGSTLLAGTVLGADFVIDGDTTLITNMVLKAGSILEAGSELAVGTVMGNDILTSAGLITTEGMDLKLGSTLISSSILTKGSTVGGNMNIAADIVLEADMLLKAGSVLLTDSILKAGTVLTQDLTAAQVGGGSGPGIKAGTVLGTDVTLTDTVYLSADMNMLKGATQGAAYGTIAAGSTIATNTGDRNSVVLSGAKFTNLSDINVTTLQGAQHAIDTLSAAIGNLDTIRSDLGSVQNQIVSTINNISVTQVNVKAAESQIRDVDFAAESATFSKHNILAQSGSYAMSQANAVQQNVLKLLQ